MKPPLEMIRISRRGRDQLIKLKKATGMESYNIVARWGLCLSLSENTMPPPVDRDSEVQLEMTWRILCGDVADELSAMVRMAFSKFEASEKIDLKEFTRRHVHRGLNFLEGRLGLLDSPIELFVSLARKKT